MTRFSLRLFAPLAICSLGWAQNLEISDMRHGRTGEVVLSGFESAQAFLLGAEWITENGSSVQIASNRMRANATGTVHWPLEHPTCGEADTVIISMFTTGSGGALTKTRIGVPVQQSGSPIGTESDFFEGSQLNPSWSILHPGIMSLGVAGGSLVIEPTQAGPAATWFDDGEGPYVYKTVQGNFDVRTVAHTSSSLNPGSPAPTQYRLGGLLIRATDSMPGNRHSVHIAIGAGSNAFPLAVEDKITLNSSSDFFFSHIPSQDLELRVTRVGNLLSRFYRSPGSATWTLMRADSHPQLGASAQVGLMAYSYASPADIVATFDAIVFHP